MVSTQYRLDRKWKENSILYSQRLCFKNLYRAELYLKSLYNNVKCITFATVPPLQGEYLNNWLKEHAFQWIKKSSKNRSLLILYTFKMHGHIVSGLSTNQHYIMFSQILSKMKDISLFWNAYLYSSSFVFFPPIWTVYVSIVKTVYWFCIVATSESMSLCRRRV